jgi:hypothetical protein
VRERTQIEPLCPLLVYVGCRRFQKFVSELTAFFVPEVAFEISRPF